MEELHHQQCGGENIHKFSEAEINEHLGKVKDWEHHDDEIKRTYTFDDFREALSFTTELGELAEDQGHHPVITLEWGKVTVVMTTHKVNGLSINDFIFAAKANHIFDLGEF